MVDKERHDKEMSRAVKTILGVLACAPMHTPPLCICTIPTPTWSAPLDKTHSM